MDEWVNEYRKDPEAMYSKCIKIIALRRNWKRVSEDYSETGSVAGAGPTPQPTMLKVVPSGRRRHYHNYYLETFEDSS